MATLEEKIKTALEQQFPPPSSKLEIDPEDGIIGILISPRFEGVEFIDRQNMIWDILDPLLSNEEKRQIHTIVATTEEEYAGHMTAGWEGSHL